MTADRVLIEIDYGECHDGCGRCKSHVPSLSLVVLGGKDDGERLTAQLDESTAREVGYALVKMSALIKLNQLKGH